MDSLLYIFILICIVIIAIFFSSSWGYRQSLKKLSGNAIQRLLKIGGIEYNVKDIFVKINKPDKPNESLSKQNPSEDLESSGSIIFISGLGNGHEWWNWDEMLLTKKGQKVRDELKITNQTGLQNSIKDYTTMSFDMPGVGNSTLNDIKMLELSIQDLAKMIHDLAKYHKLPTPYTLVAHSAGALITYAYKELYPVKKIILIDPSPDFIIKDSGKIQQFLDKYKESKEFKHLVSATYMKLYNKAKYVIPDDAIVHYNIDKTKSDWKQFEEYQTQTFKHTIRHEGKSHWIHINDPQAIIESIKS